MSTIVVELYDALNAAGVRDDQARAAAAAIIATEAREGLATKADLAPLEPRLIRWNVGTIIAMTAVFAAIVEFV
jgi:hypothetical protein